MLWSDLPVSVAQHRARRVEILNYTPAETRMLHITLLVSGRPVRISHIGSDLQLLTQFLSAGRPQLQYNPKAPAHLKPPPPSIVVMTHQQIEMEVWVSVCTLLCTVPGVALG